MSFHKSLSSDEIFWRDHYHFLRSHGYTLRRRYEPDWVPSWTDGSKNLRDCEDGVLVFSSVVIDATRKDGTFVAIKRVDVSYISTANELAIGRMFSAPELSSDKNHCVPFLDIIQPKDGENYAFIIMPVLYFFDYPPFETVGEGVDFIRQIFEGLQFMHSRNVVHGDIKFHNIMADIVPLYDHPPHPQANSRRRDFTGRISPNFSRTVKPLRYYLIDFDLSELYGSKDARLRTPPWGGDKTVPEHQPPNIAPCDPFPVDVYCLGDVLKRYLMDGSEQGGDPTIGFEFMRDLVSQMMNEDPKKRPTMDEVVPRFETIINGLNDWTLRSPVMTVGKEYGIFGLMAHWLKQFSYVVRCIPAMPQA